VGGYPNPTSIYPNGPTKQSTNPNLISNQTQNLQNSQQSNSDRYAALAELDTEIKHNHIQSERHKYQRQVSTGQAIFGAAPSSANPFLSKTSAPTQNMVQNPFGKNP
jgi:hypothetical protein